MLPNFGMPKVSLSSNIFMKERNLANGLGYILLPLFAEFVQIILGTTLYELQEFFQHNLNTKVRNRLVALPVHGENSKKIL